MRNLKLFKIKYRNTFYFDFQLRILINKNLSVISLKFIWKENMFWWSLGHFWSNKWNFSYSLTVYRIEIL